MTKILEDEISIEEKRLALELPVQDICCFEKKQVFSGRLETLSPAQS